MAKSANQKLKLFYILSLLEEESDEEHPVSMKHILASLERNGIQAERKSIYSDLEALRALGFGVEYESGGYYLSTRQFELAELKLLVDAVQASKFVSEKQSNRLIQKLEKFASRHEAEGLQRQVRVANRIKSSNMSTLYLIDGIHQAIHSNRAITFTYYEWNLEKKLVARHEGKRYLVSPWLLIWEDENYYLLSYDHEASMVKYFRVDKMKEIRVEEQSRQGEEMVSGQIPGELLKNTFGMYAGEKKRVTLEFHNKLVGVAIDRFGMDIPIINRDNSHFQTIVEVCISSQFYGWLAGLGADVAIVEPQEERQKYIQYLQEIILCNGTSKKKYAGIELP